jgi:DNA-binding XRE family transcriptional regulator
MAGGLMAPQPEVRIGERLKFYRQAKGKTQAVVAGLAGVSEDYLGQIERGLKTPTPPTGTRPPPGTLKVFERCS